MCDEDNHLYHSKSFLQITKLYHKNNVFYNINNLQKYQNINLI